MRRRLNKLYEGAAASAVLCLVGLLAMVVLGYIGLPRHLAEWLGGLGLSPLALLTLLALLTALMLFNIVLGCLLDGISRVALTMGVILPTVQKAGIDLVWFGIVIVQVVELAQITPPMGFNLFLLQAMTRREIGWIARVTLPFFLSLRQKNLWASFGSGSLPST